MKTVALPFLLTLGFLGSAGTCSKEPKSPPKILPLDEAFQPSVQIKETFEIHAGGCGEDPDLASDFNHYTETNVRVVEKFGLTVKVIQDSKRCGYTLRKGAESLEMEWSEFDPFWEKFRTFYGIKD